MRTPSHFVAGSLFLHWDSHFTRSRPHLYPELELQLALDLLEPGAVLRAPLERLTAVMVLQGFDDRPSPTENVRVHQILHSPST